MGIWRPGRQSSSNASPTTNRALSGSLRAPEGRKRCRVGRTPLESQAAGGCAVENDRSPALTLRSWWRTQLGSTRRSRKTRQCLRRRPIRCACGRIIRPLWHLVSLLCILPGCTCDDGLPSRRAVAAKTFSLVPHPPHFTCAPAAVRFTTCSVCEWRADAVEAVWSGYCAAVAEALQVYPEAVHHVDGVGNTLLHIACKVKLLFGGGALPAVPW